MVRPWQFHETNATMTSKIVKITNQDPQEKTRIKTLLWPSCMQIWSNMPIGNSGKSFEEESKGYHEATPLGSNGPYIPSVCRVLVWKVYDEWWPNKWLYINTILPFFQNPRSTTSKKLWKIGTLRVPRRVHPWCPGVEFDLLWTSSVAKGCASGRLGSSTPSAPLERKVNLLGMDRLRIRCCWPLPMLESVWGLTNLSSWEANHHLQLRPVRDHVRTKIFWNWCEFWVGTLAASWK